MPSHSVGTIFIDFDANFEPVTRAQKKLLEDATSTSLNIEDAWRKLNIKSATEFDLMRQKVQNAYDAIKANAQTTANDILRAEKAKTDQLTQINEQQFGKQVSLYEMIKTHWVAASAAIVGAWYTISSAADHVIGTYTQFATQVRDLSFLSGGSAQDVSKLVTAMDDLGVETGTVETAISRMSKAIYEGDPALSRLGVSVRTSSGALKDGLTLFYETVDALKDVTSEVERNRLAQEIFGRGWTSMIPIIQKGSAVIKQLGEENAALGLTMDQDGIRKAQEYRMAMNELKNAGEAFAVTWGNRLIPVFTDFVRAATLATTGLRAHTGAWEDHVVALENVSRWTVELDDEQKRLAASSANIVNHTQAQTTTTGELNSELEKRLKFEAQLAQLNVAAQTAAAVSEEDKLAAAIANVNAQRKAGLAELATRESKTKLPEELAQIAALRSAAERKANAEIEKLRRESQERLWNLAVKNNAGYVAMADEEIALSEEVAKQEIHRLEAMWKATEDVQQKTIAGWVAVAEEEIANAEEAQRYELKRLEELTRATERAKEQEIDSWVRVAEEEIDLSERTAREVAELQQQKARASEDAWKRSLLNTRGIFEDSFGALSRAVSTSVEGIILGTTKMEDALKRIGESIALSLIDSIVNRGLKEVEKALGDFLFGAEGGGSGLLGGILGGVGGALGGLGSDALDWLGAFQSGAWNIPRSGIARLHEGEMVLPPETAKAVRASAPAGTGFGGGGGGPDWSDLTGGMLRDIILKRAVNQVTSPIRDYLSQQFLQLLGGGGLGTMGIAGAQAAIAGYGGLYGAGGVALTAADLAGMTGSELGAAIASGAISSGASGLYAGMSAATMAELSGVAGSSAAAGAGAGAAAASLAAGALAIPALIYAIGSTLSAAKEARQLEEEGKLIQQIFAGPLAQGPAAFAKWLSDARTWPDTARDNSYFHEGINALAMAEFPSGMYGYRMYEGAYQKATALAAQFLPVMKLMGVEGGFWQPDYVAGTMALLPLMASGKWPSPLQFVMSAWSHAQENPMGHQIGAADSKARGDLFMTNGPTHMIVGEAGQETVAVLRNPRNVEGGMGVTINGPLIQNATITSDIDIARVNEELGFAIETAYRRALG